MDGMHIGISIQLTSRDGRTASGCDVSKVTPGRGPGYEGVAGNGRRITGNGPHMERMGTRLREKPSDGYGPGPENSLHEDHFPGFDVPAGSEAAEVMPGRRFSHLVGYGLRRRGLPGARARPGQVPAPQRKREPAMVKPARPRSQGSFSLMEVLMGFFVPAIAFVMLGAYQIHLRMGRCRSAELSDATQVAISALELVKGELADPARFSSNHKAVKHKPALCRSRTRCPIRWTWPCPAVSPRTVCSRPRCIGPWPKPQRTPATA